RRCRDHAVLVDDDPVQSGRVALVAIFPAGKRGGVGPFMEPERGAQSEHFRQSLGWTCDDLETRPAGHHQRILQLAVSGSAETLAPAGLETTATGIESKILWQPQPRF